MGEESVGRVAIYSLLPTDLPTDINTVGESVGKTVGTRHRTDLLFKSLGDSVGIFNGAPVTSPVRIWHFKSVGDSVGIFYGEQVPSRVRAPGFNSVGKITRKNLGAIYLPFFH